MSFLLTHLVQEFYKSLQIRPLEFMDMLLEAVVTEKF